MEGRGHDGGGVVEQTLPVEVAAAGQQQVVGHGGGDLVVAGVFRVEGQGERIVTGLTDVGHLDGGFETGLWHYQHRCLQNLSFSGS